MSKTNSRTRVWALSKLINVKDGVGELFNQSSFNSLTGHNFDQNRDFVFIMCGDEAAAGDPGTFTTPSYNIKNGCIYFWCIGSAINQNNKTGTVRVNTLVVSSY